MTAKCLPAWCQPVIRLPAAARRSTEAEVSPLPQPGRPRPLCFTLACACPGRGRRRGVGVPAGQPALTDALTPALQVPRPRWGSQKPTKEWSGLTGMVLLRWPCWGSSSKSQVSSLSSFFAVLHITNEAHALLLCAVALQVSSNRCGNPIYTCVQNLLNVCLAINCSNQTTNPNQKKGSAWFISII